MIARLTLASTIFHVLTFIAMGLAPVYESKLLGFLGLLSLAIGLLMNKLIFTELGYDTDSASDKPEVEEYTLDDPYISGLVGKQKDPHK